MMMMLIIFVHDDERLTRIYKITELLSLMTGMSVVKSLQQSFVEHKLRLNFISMRKIFICYDTFIAQGNH